MKKAVQNISKNRVRDFLVYAAMFLVLFTSCPIKNGLLNLADIPVNKEQSFGKKSNFLIVEGSEKCCYKETLDPLISQEVSISSIDFLPILIVAATFLFLLSFTLGKEQLHPLYGNLKISGSLPIFLQYRKLIL